MRFDALGRHMALPSILLLIAAIGRWLFRMRFGVVREKASKLDDMEKME